DQRRRTTGNHRSELITERGAAVAKPRRKGLGDQRRLRAVHHVVRDKRYHDCGEDRPRNCGIQHAEIEEREQAADHYADQVHFLPPMRSERCPKIGIEKNETTEATSTAVRMKSRDIFSVPTP